MTKSMRNVFASLAMISMILTGVFVTEVAEAPEAQAAAPKYTYTNKMDRQYVYIDSRPTHKTLTAVFYKYRTPVVPGRGSRAVKPYMAIVSFNIAGKKYNCADKWFENGIKGYRFNLYFWRPYTGENHNPPTIFVPCDESTISSRALRWGPRAKVPWLIIGPGEHKPRWKVNITQVNNGALDFSASHSQYFGS